MCVCVCGLQLVCCRRHKPLSYKGIDKTFEILSIFNPFSLWLCFCGKLAPFEDASAISSYSTSPRHLWHHFFFVRLWPCFLRGSFLTSQFLDPSPFSLFLCRDRTPILLGFRVWFVVCVQLCGKSRRDLDRRELERAGVLMIETSTPWPEWAASVLVNNVNNFKR